MEASREHTRALPAAHDPPPPRQALEIASGLFSGSSDTPPCSLSHQGRPVWPSSTGRTGDRRGNAGGEGSHVGWRDVPPRVLEEVLGRSQGGSRTREQGSWGCLPSTHEAGSPALSVPASPSWAPSWHRAGRFGDSGALEMGDGSAVPRARQRALSCPLRAWPWAQQVSTFCKPHRAGLAVHGAIPWRQPPLPMWAPRHAATPLPGSSSWVLSLPALPAL